LDKSLEVEIPPKHAGSLFCTISLIFAPVSDRNKRMLETRRSWQGGSLGLILLMGKTNQHNTRAGTMREIVGNVTEAAEEGEIPDPNPDNDQRDFWASSV
jgi:hypothetical protein